MKTKAVLVMFLLLSLCIGVGGSVIRGGTSGGGESDSAISVIAYFCKNDTMKYVRTVSEFSVKMVTPSANRRNCVKSSWSLSAILRHRDMLSSSFLPFSSTAIRRPAT